MLWSGNFGDNNLALAYFFAPYQALGRPNFSLAFLKNTEADGIGLPYDLDETFVECQTYIVLLSDDIILPFLQRVISNSAPPLPSHVMTIAHVRLCPTSWFGMWAWHMQSVYPGPERPVT